MGQQAPAVETRYKWWVLATVVFGAFASILDSTIVNTALPKIQHVFGTGLHEASYVSTGYTLAAGVVVPAAGFLANRFGIKRIYLLSLTLFTLGSALCGLAPSMSMLIVFRILQGAGGAALFPLSFALLFSAFSQQERGLANGVFGIPILVAPALGPTLGGYLSQYVDWRWIFYVNLPVGVAGVIMGWRVLREGATRPDLRLDIPGFVLASSGLGLLLYGLSNLAYDGWNSVNTVSGPIIVALALLAIFIPVELRARQPLLDLRLYTRRNYAVGNVIAWLATVGLFGPAFLLPQYLQTLRGLTPFGAGLLLLWQGVGAIGGTITSGRIYNRVGVHALVVFGALTTAVTGYLLAGWSTTTSALSVLPWILFVRGVGLPIMLQSTGTATLDGITGAALPGATTLNVVGRNVVASLSVAVLINILQQRTVTHIAELARKAGQAARHAGAQANAAAIHGHVAPVYVAQGRAMGFQDVFLITAVIILPALGLAFLLRQPGRGASVPRDQLAEKHPAAR